MFFKPHGVATGGVIDPDELAQEFDEAARVANETGQYQWLLNAFTSTDRLRKGSHVVVETSHKHADLKGGTGTRPIITTAFGAPNSQIFQIPYNTGFHEIGGSSAPHTVGISWNSRQPEFVVAIYSFQYIRERRDQFPVSAFGDTLDFRAQFRIAVDDSPIPGTGPFAVPLDGHPKGTGFGGRAFRSCAVAMLPLGAGQHYITGFAAQGPAIPLVDKRVIKRTRHLDNPPFEGICIGSRRLILMRFKKGLSGMGG